MIILSESKRSFIPSKWELMRVTKIVKAMKEGRYKTQEELREERKEQKKGIYMIWNDDEDDVIAESRRFKFHLPAPKMPLPGHAESYNPPEEYLLSAEEKKQMEDMDPADRQYNFIPQKHDCLRHVAGYKNLIKERFERCLDLYLCPRKLKRRLNIDPETLVPRLPKPRELRPYPNSLCLQYLGHTKAVRAISVSPDGQYLASGSDDGTVRLWEVDTSLCVGVWHIGQTKSDDDGDSESGSSFGAVTCLAWNPSPSHHLLAAATGEKVVFITTGTGDEDSTEITETLLSAATLDASSSFSASSSSSSRGTKADGDDDNDDDDDDDDSKDNRATEDAGPKDQANTPKKKNALVSIWSSYDSSSASKKESKKDKDKKAIKAAEMAVLRFGCVVGPRVELKVANTVTYLTWHHKGDYLAVLAPGAGAQEVTIHQVSKAKSQAPFTKSPGHVQAVQFHPTRPFFFVATQQHVKIFHLVEQKLIKRLLSGCKWISSLDVHPSGDHIIIGSYDRRVVWFDLDLSSTPYKTLKYHEKAIRHLQYHRKFPLMASASDDGSVHIFHATVFSDLTRNPMIVPLKILKGHGVIGGLGVIAVAFHPRQPWIFSAGADGVINLFQDI